MVSGSINPALWRRLDAAARAELSSLEQERDPELAAEAWLAFAARKESAGNLEVAGGLYAAVSESTPVVGAQHVEPLQSRARIRLDAILGRGAFGPRAEFLLRHFAQETADPAMIFAMGLAGAAFRLTRLATLSRLSAAPTANIFTRGFGARALAGLTGFAVEAPTFTLAGRFAGQTLGRELDWTLPVLGRDLASSFLVLGGLKAAGWAFGSAYRGVAGSVGAVRERPLQRLFQQGGMLTGILLGHSLETWSGLRPPADGATTLVDSLAMLVQFNIAGRLVSRAFGSRFAAWERGLDLQAHRLERLGPALRGPRLDGVIPSLDLQPAFAGSAATRPRQEISSQVWMAMLPEAPGGGSAKSARDPRETLRGELTARIQELRSRIESTEAGDRRIPRWREETDWLEQAPTVSLPIFFQALSKLQAFYSRNTLIVGIEGNRWLNAMKNRLFAEIAEQEGYAPFLELEAGGSARLDLPHGLEAPSTLAEMPPESAGLRQIELAAFSGIYRLAYVRISELRTIQEVVSEGKLAEYREQISGRVKFPRPLEVGFDPRHNRYLLLDGHHRALAASLEGRSFVLASMLSHFPVGRDIRSVPELRVVTREEYERVAQQNDFGEGMSIQAESLRGLFEGLEEAAGSGGESPPKPWTEWLRRVWNRR